VATIQKQHLINSGRMKKSTASRKVEWLGVNLKRHCHTSTSTDTKLKAESDPFKDVEEDEDELENKLVLEDC